VLVTGASGGVGTAAIQLARRRGAVVTAVASAAKAAALSELGAHAVVGRDDDLVASVGNGAVDVVVDVVGGPRWSQLLDVLARGGRYVVSGAIAGPLVELDLRTLYLNDLTLLGATYQEPDLFDVLVRYVEAGEIRPLVHATYPLERIAEAQADFVAKDHIGKLVLTVP
jgi:NADPH:quinone reductase-like Zn-dependent oxidoreductase